MELFSEVISETEAQQRKIAELITKHSEEPLPLPGGSKSLPPYGAAGIANGFEIAQRLPGQTLLKALGRTFLT